MQKTIFKMTCFHFKQCYLQSSIKECVFLCVAKMLKDIKRGIPHNQGMQYAESQHINLIEMRILDCVFSSQSCTKYIESAKDVQTNWEAKNGSCFVTFVLPFNRISLPIYHTPNETTKWQDKCDKTGVIFSIIS